MNVFLARQPIYDIDQKIYGYEILYRNSSNNYFPDVNENIATRELTSNLLSEFGFHNVTDEKLGAINFGTELLMSELPFLFDPKHTIIEILEDVILDQKLVERIKLLKKRNYILALDDFIDDGTYDEIIDYIDIIKVEYPLISPEKRKSIPQKYKDKKLVAERIETEEEYKAALKDGYKNFQGYYFSKPILVSKSSISMASSTYYKLIKEIEKPFINYKELSRIIELDASLTYKLLVYINSMAFYRGNKVKNIEQALVRLGTFEIKKWLVLLLLKDITPSKDNEFIKQSLIRGVFLEKISSNHISTEESKVAYMVGMMSKIENLLDEDMKELLEAIDLDDSIRSAFTGKDDFLSDALDCITSYEKSNWTLVDAFCEKYKLAREHVLSTYMSALKYADSVFAMPM